MGGGGSDGSSGGGGGSDGELGFDSHSNGGRTVVLVGRTGNGKSATGNSILGRKEFRSMASSAGVTDECQLHPTVLKDGQILNVIDTPGIIDFTPETHMGERIVECVKLAKDGIHAVLLVFSVRARFSKEEESSLRCLRELFGEKIIDHVIVVFTGADELEEEGVALEEYLGRCCPAPLKDLLEQCGNRKVLFDNKTKDEAKKVEQLQELATLINTVVALNDGQPYTENLIADLKEREQRFHPKTEEVNSLKGYSEQEVCKMKELKKFYEEQVQQMIQSIDSRMKETLQGLQEEVEREKAERYKDEGSVRSSDKQICDLWNEIHTVEHSDQVPTVQPASSSQHKAAAAAAERGKTVAREVRASSAVGGKRKSYSTLPPSQPSQTKKRKKVAALSEKATPEAMPGGVYFDVLLDGLDEILGTSAKVLEDEQLKGEQLSNFIVRHSLLAVLGAMKQKEEISRLAKERQELEVAQEKLAGEKKKLEDNVAFLTSESQKAWSNVEGLGLRLKSAEEAHKEAEERLAREVAACEALASNINSKLNNSVAKLRKTRRELESALERADDALKEAEEARKEAEEAKEEVAQVKAGVEAHVSKVREEVESEICSRFLYTLWKEHLEMDFSFFGEEAVEEVKKYAAQAAEKEAIQAFPVPNQVGSYRPSEGSQD